MSAKARSPRPRFHLLLAERPLWLLLLLITLFFARPLFLGQTFFFRDLASLCYSQRVRLVELVRSSGFPLWDPYLHGGQPFLGNLSNIALYPTGLLYFVLPSVTAFNIEIVAHFLLCAIATYSLARVLGLSPIASFIAGAIFTFCGFTLSAANLFTKLISLPHAVLLLLFSHLFFLEGKFRWFAASVAAGTLCILGGTVEWFLLAAATGIAWSLAFPYPSGTPRRLVRLGWCALLGLSIFGIAAIQILPTAAVVRESMRGTGFLPASVWSLSPRRLPELIIPGFIGSRTTLNESEFWGSRLEFGLPLILSIYWGLPTLALAVSEGVSRVGSLPKRIRRLFLAVLGIALLLALGRYLFLTTAFYRVFPVNGLLRYPVKFLAAALLPVALLAGSSADSLACGSESSIPLVRRLGPFLAVSALILGAIAAVVAFGAASSLERFFFLQSLQPRLRPLLAAGLAHAAAGAAALALLLRLWRGARARWCLPGLAAILLLDLGLAGQSVNPFGPRQLLSEEPPLARTVRRQLAGGRFFRDSNPDGVHLRAPSNQIFWWYFWHRTTLADHTASSFDIPVIFHDDYDGLASHRLVRLRSILEKLPWDQRTPLLSAGDVTIFLTSLAPHLSQFQPVGEVANASDIRFFLFQNLAAAPRVGFVSQWAAVHSETEALRAMLSRGFDPRRHVILEDESAPTVPGGCGSGSVVQLQARPTSSRYRVQAPCEGYVVFSEAFDGWKVSVDGAHQPLLRANLAFSGVRVPPGTHTVDREYRPASVSIGAGISLLTALVIAGAALVPRIRRAQRRGESANAQRRDDGRT